MKKVEIKEMQTTAGSEWQVIRTDEMGDKMVVSTLFNKHFKTRKGAAQWVEKMGWVVDMGKPYTCAKCGMIFDYNEYANFMCKECTDKSRNVQKEKAARNFDFVDEWIASLDRIKVSI